jgi:hypothetical protein
MCRLIQGAAADSYFQQCAAAIPKRWCLPATTGALAVAAGDWAFTKHFLKFQQDAMLCQVLAGEGDALEGLFDPRLLIRAVSPAGDCDDFTMFLCALLQCQGIGWEIVTVAADRGEPGRWSHVYPRAVVNGRRLTLDASHGKAPGWEVPAYDVQRVQVWGPDGQPINAPARGDVGVSHLHGYVRVRQGRYWRGFGRLGQLPDDSSDDTGGGFVGPTLPQGPATPPLAGYLSDGTPVYAGQSFSGPNTPAVVGYSSDGLPIYGTTTAPTGTASSSSSSSSTNPLAALAASAIGAGATLGKEALLPAGYSLSPTGAVVPSAATSLAAALGGSGGTLLLWGGLGLVVILALMSSGGHR